MVPTVMTLPSGLSEAELIEMARRRGRADRQELLDNITDLFMADGARLSDRERALITGILHRLVGTVEAEVRRALAERLKARTDAPPDLVLLLAGDDIEIARPLLEHSPLLRDPDLIQVIRSRGREHWLAISTRRQISADVSDAIVATGDADVIALLLRNEDADLSRQAMAYLVAEAERVDGYQEPLLRRRDLPPDLAMRMYWWVSAALRQYILNRFAVPEALVDDVLEGAALDAAGAPEANGQPLSAIARDLVDRLSEHERISPHLLIGFLRCSRVAAFIAGFARFAAVPEPIARRVTLDADGESLAVLCRAADVNRNDFATLFLLIQNVRHGLRPLAPQRLNDILGFFDAIPIANALAARKYWCRHPEYLDAVETLAGPAEQAQPHERHDA
jgi:uncharacterized protein (DUF2336 family)